MPNLDSCHQQVVNALQKAGWITDPAPFFARVEGLAVFADIQAQQQNGKPQQIIVIEVKCFVETSSDQEELYRAIGQYLIYRSIIHAREPDLPLYLAIPDTAYFRIFNKAVVQQVVQETHIRLLVVDIEREEIVRWLD